jgi:hypothetical protein
VGIKKGAGGGNPPAPFLRGLREVRT